MPKFHKKNKILNTGGAKKMCTHFKKYLRIISPPFFFMCMHFSVFMFCLFKQRIQIIIKGRFEVKMCHFCTPPNNKKHIVIFARHGGISPDFLVNTRTWHAISSHKALTPRCCVIHFSSLKCTHWNRWRRPCASMRHLNDLLLLWSNSETLNMSFS